MVSMVRGAKRDTPVGYHGAIGAMDVTRARNGSAMYENGEVEDPEGGDSIYGRTFHHREKHRDAWICELQK